MNDSPLSRLLVPVRRWWWVIVGLVVVTGVVTVLTMPEPPDPEEAALLLEDVEQYRATHLLIRNEAAPTQLSFELIQLLASQGDLTNRIAEVAGAEVSASDVEAVRLSTDANTSTMSIAAVQPTPGAAEELANVYADELVAFLDERALNSVQNDLERTTDRLEDIEVAVDELQEEIDQLPDGDPDRDILVAEREGLLNDFATLRATQRSLEQQLQGATDSFITLEEPSAVPVVDEDDASLSTLRLPGRQWLRVAMLTVVATLVGIVSVLVIDFLDTRIRTRRQAEDAFGLPVLAELPRRRRAALKQEPLPAYTDPGGVTAEVLRALRLSLSLAPRWHLTSLIRSSGNGAIGAKTPVALDGDLRSMLVTSPLTGDGKSTLVANLAVSFAEGGKRVLVVDCDFRRPAVGTFFEIVPGPGLRELASIDERPIEDLATATIARNVAMVRSGTRGVTPSWFMASAGELVRRCTDIADLVIFDTGPITLTNEASALLAHVDTSLVALRAGRAAPDQARGTVEQLTQVGAHVSGLVLVGSEGRRRYGYGYYGSDHRKGRSSSADITPEATPPEGFPEELAGAGDVWGAKLRSADTSSTVEEEEGASAGSGERERGADG